MDRARKNLLIFLTSLLIFIEFFGLILLPLRSQAEGLGYPVEVMNTPINPVNTQNKPLELKQTMSAQLLSSALGALVHGFSYYMRKLAYDSAMYVAHAGKGQSALVYKDGFTDYLWKTAKDSVADAIGELGKPFGLNLCQPPDVLFNYFLLIGLNSLYLGTEGPKPNCTWQEMKGSWENADEKYFGENGQLTTEKMFSNALRFENTDFGIAVGHMERVDRIQSMQVAGAQASRLEGEGFKALTDLITGNNKTPAQVIKEETFSATNKHQSTLTASQVSGIYSSGALQVIPLAGSVFLNTLMTEGVKQMLEMFLDDGVGSEDTESVLSFESAGFQQSLKKAQEIFSSFLAVKIEQRENYDLLTEFTTCPDTAPTIPGLNNCVMDDSLREAVRRADTGQPMTIREAIKEGLLHPDWILASPRRVIDNTSYGCYKNAYCYSNIQKMRRSRILPLGFEIAALLADPDHPQEKWTLEYVMNHFDDCKDENKDGIIESDSVNYPYCHLIDPNWIIKAPDSRCNGFIYSSNLIDQSSGLRAQECVDVQTRIKETQGLNKSQTNDFFGYCSREKKVWRLPGEACESYYNTCTTYTSGDGAFVSYLAKTVDYGECNFDSVGCLAYSTEKNNDKWVASINAEGINYKENGRNQALYFNERIKNYSCSATDNGCSGFYLGTLKSGTTDEYINNYDKPAFIKKAPDYLGCYDINKSQNSPEINWPQTKPELGQVSQDKKCADFAQVCLPEEVGCDSYTAKKGPSSTPIPGIAGEADKCDASCVGYDTFKQSETKFAPSEFPLYFIPQNGKSCPAQYAGCDEFTNIDELAKGGEGLEYYTDIKYCELPNEQNQKVFYSWYGSMSEGYVLKLHKLRPVSDKDLVYLQSMENNNLIDLYDLGNETIDDIFPLGSPAYATDNPLEVTELYTSCNADGYNKLINGGMPGIDGTASLDCRALYDKDGKVYYRILKDTITVSEECHPLRKTTAYFYDDAALKTQATCEERGGYWNNSACQRCTNGGIYKDGACVYWAIAKTGESQSCAGPSNNKSAYNGCREYVGNEGGNVETVDPFPLDFEPTNNDLNALNAAKAGWSPADKTQVVAESVQVGLHSLKVTADYLNYLIASSTLEKDGWYELSFWSRGKNQNLGAYFVQTIAGSPAKSAGSFTSADYKLSIGDDWKEYKLGPIQFTGDPAKDTILIFESKTQSPPILYFLDNVELRLVPDTYAIVKDSWKKKFPYGGQSVNADVPLVCDSNPTDPFPGDALGCRAYSEESTGNIVNVTGFEKLCRVEAVGCRAVFDSYNTTETDMTAYNVQCKGMIGDADCQLTLKVGGEKLGDPCKIEQGKSNCYIDEITVPDNVSLPSGVNKAEITDSTIIIPADTASDKPVYLTVHPNFSCLEKVQGCQEVGAEEQTLPDKNSSVSYEHNATYLINDPAQYVGANRTLCRADLVGCEDFKAGSDIFYFKNPIKTGNSFCEYKTKVENNGVEYKGWFLKDVGACYTSAGAKTDNICAKDSDCGATETCEDKGKVPCYNDYLQAGGFYDIWSNNTPQYKGNVGVCPSEKNGCRELIDPADISQIHPDGEPYYTIFDNRVTGKAGECELKASQVEGCVLFNKTDEPNLLYDSAQTYKNSEDKNFAPVSLVTNTNNKDSNLLLKVIRDRQCAEWLACQGSLPVPDTQSGTGERYSCYALQPCAEGSSLECTTPSTLTDENDSRLLYGEYITRDVSWSGSRDYAGYSLFEKTPPANLEFITIKKEITGLEQDAIFMGYINKKATSACSAGATANGANCGGKGICYDKKCVVSPDDSYPAELLGDQATAKTNFYKYLYRVECRGYPEQNSPFKGKLGDVSQFTQSFLSNASFCAEGENCDCNYIKVEYGTNGSSNETKYYELGGELHSDLQKGGICQEGPSHGKSCSSDKDCIDKIDEVNNGVCIRQSKRNTRIGWNGYCLERDLSRHINGRVDDAPDAFACLTWLPLDYVPGLFDIYYSDPSVGYVPPAGAGNPGQAYCTEMLGLGNLSPNLTFTCKIGVVFDGNTLLDNTCQSDLPKFEGKAPEVFDTSASNPIEEEKVSFSTIQSYTLSLIKALSGTGSGFIPQSYKNDTYHYVSRVDVAMVPSKGDDLWDTPDGGEWDDNYANYGTGYYIKSSGGGKYGTTEIKLEDASKLLMQNSVFYAMAMSQGGFSPNHPSVVVPYAPLFPDVETFGVDGGEGGWLDALKQQGVAIEMGNAIEPDEINNQNSIVDNYTLLVESTPVKNLDSGVLRHRKTRAETFLTKDMIYAVSFVPMWLSEGGGDAVGQYVPAMGYPMTIYMDKEYPAIDGLSTDVDMKKSAAGSKCVFCKYWVAKTNHPNDDAMNKHKPAEGYLLQWFAGDPMSPDGWLEESVVAAYANSNSYLMNPLDANTVQCKDKTDPNNQGNHFIAVEVLFDKEDGRFIGYRSRNCMERGESQTGYAMAVVFTLKPMCVEAVKIIDADGMTNKAYTDRVWTGGEEVEPNKAPSNFIDKNTDAGPYGSARFGSLDNCEPDNPWCYLQRNPDSGILHGGTPWQCLNSFKSTNAGASFSGKCLLTGSWQGNDVGYNRTQEATGYVSSNPSYENTQKYLLFDSLFATPYGKSSRLGDVKYIMTSGYSEITNALNQQDNKLNAFTGDKTYDYVYDPTPESLKPIAWLKDPTILNYGWKFVTSTDDIFSSFMNGTKPVVLFGDHAAFRGVPPRIYPLGDCEGQKCELDSKEQGFSVNGISKNKVDDKLFGVKVKMAQVQFFAWADHNQMPLRRIMVDWREKGINPVANDNTISGTSEGYYTNYKPYCGEDSGKAKECVGIKSNTVISDAVVQNKSGNGTGCSKNLDCVLPAVCVGSTLNCTEKGKTITTKETLGSGITCQNDKECPANYTCSDVGPKFGNQPNKTCKDSPVIRIFNYTCDAADATVAVDDFKIHYKQLAGIAIEQALGQKWYNFLKDKGFKDDAKVCVFQPRVQVLDNWGWCTGSCKNPVTNLAWPSGGCYNDEVVVASGETMTLEQCEGSADEKWKAFSNIIVVAPGE